MTHSRKIRTCLNSLHLCCRESVVHSYPNMPDTIVPIVRRPIRRTSNDPAVKPTEVSELRKLSIGGESNSVSTSSSSGLTGYASLSSATADSPLRYRKTISSLNKEREKTSLPASSVTSSAPTTRKSSLFDDSELKNLPPPITSTYEVPSNTSGFPHAPKDNLPKLHETRHKAHKTSVSFFHLFLFNHIYYHFFYIHNVNKDNDVQDSRGNNYASNRVHRGFYLLFVYLR